LNHQKRNPKSLQIFVFRKIFSVLRQSLNERGEEEFLRFRIFIHLLQVNCNFTIIFLKNYFGKNYSKNINFCHINSVGQRAFLIFMIVGIVWLVTLGIYLVANFCAIIFQSSNIQNYLPKTYKSTNYLPLKYMRCYQLCIFVDRLNVCLSEDSKLNLSFFDNF